MSQIPAAQLRSPEGVKSGGRTIPKSYSSLIRLLVSRQIIIDLRNLQCQIVINQQTNLRETLACGRVRRIALRKLKLEESRGEKEKKKVSRFLGVELTLVQVSGSTACLFDSRLNFRCLTCLSKLGLWAGCNRTLQNNVREDEEEENGDEKGKETKTQQLKTFCE
ncbi:hypothetical protein RUM44_006373 [Polyplax serrata]|uniref:Uncharacterized protein n=1 Tax=Polyplax serrata TaxID=468196 RepID=A0ABR1AI00_POLSC